MITLSVLDTVIMFQIQQAVYSPLWAYYPLTLKQKKTLLSAGSEYSSGTFPFKLRKNPITFNLVNIHHRTFVTQKNTITSTVLGIMFV